VAFLVLPSFLGANWLSPMSTGTGIGGGIFHAVKTTRLYGKWRLDGKSQQPGAMVASGIRTEERGRAGGESRCERKDMQWKADTMRPGVALSL
jgi:hypothetical protein